MAVLSAVLLALGVGWHYVDIYKSRTVRGISFLFVAIDAAGDLFSLLSLGMLFHDHSHSRRELIPSIPCSVRCTRRSDIWD